MQSKKILLSKILLIACILYHIYINLYDTLFYSRFQTNFVNNIHKYFYFLPDSALSLMEQYFGISVLSMMASSVLILFSHHTFWNLTTIFGIVLYNIFIQHHILIVPSYFAIRDWVAIIGGLIGLIAFDSTKDKEKKAKLDIKND